MVWFLHVVFLMNINGIISVILLFVYSAATFVGVGFFRCGCTHSQGWFVMAQATCPPCSGSTDDCCPHNDQHHNEEKKCQDKDCCSVEYHHLNVDQLNVAQFKILPAKILALLFSSFLSVHEVFIAGIKECSVIVNNNSPPPDLFKIPLIYLNGQLRL